MCRGNFQLIFSAVMVVIFPTSWVRIYASTSPIFRHFVFSQFFQTNTGQNIKVGHGHPLLKPSQSFESKTKLIPCFPASHLKSNYVNYDETGNPQKSAALFCQHMFVGPILK